ncbi:Hypothetical predicted protein [Octopus vulgaris]|uniref:Uncharacterized protein n=1 Tax=Octopus vulgaris TaxID=6645 RepID=A0AA36B543_OCTVU|nr:Hypothetical predicted protein [Octopus vulgaris]
MNSVGTERAHLSKTSIVKSMRLSLSKKLSHVYMESHVILDNGCKGNDLGEFALQLLSLLQNELNIARTEVYANRVPYGLQLQWILNGGVPLFLHLKDSQKVKPKKRWSQNKASAPKLLCFPKIRKRRKKKKKIKKDKISSSLNSSTQSFSLFDKYEEEVEYKFWRPTS